MSAYKADNDWLRNEMATNMIFKKEADELRADNARLREALIWCSASEDFQEGGQAREGWLKLCKPLIEPKP